MNHLFNGELIPETNVTIEVRNAKSNELIEFQKKHNMVVTSGRNLIRDFLYGDSVNGLSYFAIGTDTTAVIATDTTLGTEVYRDSFTQVSKDSAKLTAKYYLGTANANGSTLAEAGLFNASSSGTMYARVTYDTIVKSSAITITYIWELTWNVA